MDKLHREHDFVTETWKFMKQCETRQPHDESFWTWAEDTGEALADKYCNLTFAGEWLGSYLVFLGRCDEGRI